MELAIRISGIVAAVYIAAYLLYRLALEHRAGHRRWAAYLLLPLNLWLVIHLVSRPTPLAPEQFRVPYVFALRLLAGVLVAAASAGMAAVERRRLQQVQGPRAGRGRWFATVMFGLMAAVLVVHEAVPLEGGPSD